MNTEKIAFDVSRYFSTPCVARFENSIGDIYVGIVGNIGIYCHVPRQKTTPILGVMEFDWIARVNVASDWGVRYIPVDKQPLRYGFKIPVSFVFSKLENIEGAQKLFLISRAHGEEKFLISKEKSDIERVEKIRALCSP